MPRFGGLMSTAGFSNSDTTWPVRTVGATQAGESSRRISLLPASTGHLACLFGCLVVLFQVLRICLYIRNRDLAVGASVATIARAFWIGLRFDMATASYTTVPMLIVAKLGQMLRLVRCERRVYTIGYGACGVI